MNPVRRRLLVSLTGATMPLGVRAETLREALRQRAEQRRGAVDSDDEAALEGQRSGSGGRLDLPAGTRVLKDIAYGSDDQQKLDVYIPDKASRAPILFMVHGGAWMFGDKVQGAGLPNKIARWLPLGYVLVSVNYRMSRSPDPLAQVDDVGRALAYTQDHAAEWHADPARVLVMGHSAGAHLVALLTADAGIAARQGARPWLGTVALDSAALDVVEIMERKHYGFYDRVFRNDRDYWVATSPYYRLSGIPRPMLLVCSTKRSDSCPKADAFAAKVNQLGGTAKVFRVDLGHGGLNAELGKSSAYTEAVMSFMRSLGLP